MKLRLGSLNQTMATKNELELQKYSTLNSNRSKVEDIRAD